MLVDALNPQANEQCAFSRAESSILPESPGCYVLASFSGHVLYIGQAERLRRRIGQHLDDPEKKLRTPWGVAVWVWVRQCSMMKLSELEFAWVAQYRLRNRGELPPFNRVNPPSC